MSVALSAAAFAAINVDSPLVAFLSLVLVAIVVSTYLRRARTSFIATPLRSIAASLVLLAAADLINAGRSHIPVAWDFNSITHNAMTTLAWVLRLIAVVQIRRGLPNNRSSSRLDPWIVASILLLLATELVFHPTWESTVAWDIKLNAVTATVLRGIVVIEILRIWLISGLVISRSLNWIVGGLMLAQVSEAWSLVLAINSGLAINTTPSETPQILSIVALGCLGMAGLDKSIHQKPVPAPSNGLDATGVRIFLLTMFVLLVPSLLLIFDRDILENPSHRAIHVIFTLLTVALLTLRIFSVISAYRAGLSREIVLAEITDALVRTSSVEEVQKDLRHWVVRLTGIHDLEVDARPVLWEDPQPSNSQERLPDGDWKTELLIPGRDPMALDIVWSRPVSEDKVSLLRIFARSLGVTLDRIAYSSQLTERHTTRWLESLLSNSADVVMVVNPEGRITYATSAVERLIGKAPSSLIGTLWTSLVTEGDTNRASRLLEESRRGSLTQIELRFPSANGVTRFVDCAVTWVNADDVFIVNHHDVTERHHLQAQLIDQAFHDPLTGLANRALFRDRVGQALAHARRSSGNFLVMLLDLDDFKVINDSLGHPAGDQLLCHVAERLNASLRAGDTAARLGGDEFAIVLENTHTLDEATIVAQRILDAIRRPIEILGHQVNPTASLGLALGSADSSDAETLERNADLALYEAKNQGKDRFAIFEPSMQGDAVRRLQSINDLRRAIEDQHIVPWYQPIVSLRSGAICGVESLARWDHPEKGILEPTTFIPLAEETGLIVPLGAHMLRQSLIHAAQWQKLFPAMHQNIRVTVNLSVRQVFHEHIVQEVAEALALSGISPSNVVLEITESVFLPGERLSGDRIKELSALGLNIYIDDFGTGYSSLRYLRQLPVNGIKMAREFIEHLPDPSEVGFAQAVRDLAMTLGLDDIVAEGIESEGQRRALRDLGYHLGQGYLLGKPQSEKEMRELLARSTGERWSLNQVPEPALPSSLS